MIRRASPLGAVALWASCAASFALAAAGLLDVAVPGWAFGAALLALLATVGCGVFLLGSGVFARPILGGRSTGSAVALTFDDGPDPVHTRRVLDLLDRHGQRGTFFVIGARAERHQEVIAEIVRRGHGLGNHSFHHSWMTTLRSPRVLAAELAQAGDVLERAAGVRPRWFRPPVGLLSPPVVDGARRAGLALVGWSATARDGVAGATVEEATARLTRALRPGAILVLHDAVERGAAREPIAARVLERLLPTLAERGLRSVTLDELLG